MFCFWATVYKTVRPMLSNRCLSCSLLSCLGCLSCCLSVTLVYCGQTVRRIKMKLGTEVDLGPGHIMLDGDPVPPEKGHSPHFSAHAYCEQTAGWIKMPLSTKVGLGPGHIVLNWDPAPPKKGGHSPSPNFRPKFVVANGRPSQLLLSTCFFS